MARVESDSTGENDESPSASESAVSEAHSQPEDSDDDSSTSSEEEDEAALEDKVMLAEGKILKNQYIYNEHVELISILHQLGNISRLRSAYERLSGICPMSPSQWLHWLQIEVKNATNPEDRKGLHQLFRRSFVDCYSIHIYTEWSAMSLSNGEGETDARTVLNQALELAGSDPIDGAMLWDTVREFELALLYVMDTTSEDYSAQVMRIFEIFNKQLSRPLLQTEKTIEEFRTFAEIMDAYIPNSEVLVKNVEESHDLSEIVLKQLLEYENELESTKDNEPKTILEKCETYVAYIIHVKTLLDNNKFKGCDIVNLLSVLYDRVTSECLAPSCRGESELPKSAEKISIEYIEHVREYSSDEYCFNVIEKVVRRCHRKSSLWVLKLRQMERMRKDFKNIKDEFEKALFNGFDTPEQYVDLWLCYLEILKRKTDFSSSNDIEILRKTFRLSWDSLSQMWGDEADKEFIIMQYWLRLEYHHTRDFVYAEQLFKEILEYGDNKSHGGLWMECIWLERMRGGVEKGRAMFRKAVRSSSDPRLQRAWLALERDYGSLDTLTECIRTCAEKAAEWEENKAKIANNVNNKSKFFNNKTSNRSDKNKNENFNKNKKQKPTKRPHDKSANDNQGSPPKKTLTKEVKNSNDESANKSNPKKDNAKRKIDETSNSCHSPSKKVKADDAKETKLTNNPPPGYQKNINDNGFEEDPEKNSRTVFISNLNLKVEEDNIREKLSQFGTIEEIRFGTKTFGSICYCVYENIGSVEKALLNDRTLLDDRPMFISRYCSTKDTRKKHFLYSTGIERNKLFVKNIAFDHCTADKLRKVFEKFGELKDIRIVTHKTGKPKGLAYVEYVNEGSATAAITGVDGKEVGGRALNVALSAPPPKKIIDEPIPSTSRGHARTQLFIPRVLQNKSDNGAANPTVEATKDEQSTSKLSNSDFRSMLLGNK